VALDAVVEIEGRSGPREMALEALHRLPGDTPERETELEPGDLIVALRLPSEARNFAAHARYLKVRDRASFAFAVVSAAAALQIQHGVIKEARLALGGVAAKPWRARAARKLERAREHTRIEFVAGYRALAAAHGDFATLTQAATQLSCALADVPAGITKSIEDRRASTSAIKRLEERLATLEAQPLLQQNPETPAGVRLIVATPPDATPAYMALLAAKLTTEKNVIALLVSRETGHVVAARSADGTQDIGATLRESLKEFQAKGGGAKHFAQGALPDPVQTDAFIKLAKSRLTSS
jgi:hypothetical protein